MDQTRKHWGHRPMGITKWVRTGPSPRGTRGSWQKQGIARGVTCCALSFATPGAYGLTTSWGYSACGGYTAPHLAK